MNAAEARNQHGFGSVSVLLALLVVALLGIAYLKMQSTGGQRSVGITAIDSSQAVACMAQRRAAESAITGWVMTHPGRQPTLDQIERDGIRLPHCPAGGRYSLKGRHLICSLHP